MKKLSKVEAAILSELSACSTSMYAGELISNSPIKLRLSTIFVHLYSLEEQGYISSKEESSETQYNEKNRRKYKITGLGNRVLQEAVLTPNSFLRGFYGR